MLAMQDILICIDLDNIQTLCIFVLPRSDRRVTDYIFTIADNRAGSCATNLSVGHFLAEKGGSSFLYIYLTNFSAQMPRSEKVSEGARGASNATRNPAKKDPSAFHIYHVRIRAVCLTSYESRVEISQDRTYGAYDRSDAIRRAIDNLRSHLMQHEIDVSEFQCRAVEYHHVESQSNRKI